MDVKFANIIANASDFPAAKIKANPNYSLFDPASSFKKNALDFVTFTKNGRGAIGIAAHQLKDPKRKNVVLVPAYHCPALVEPFIWLGYEIRFYPVNEDLSIDLSSLASLLKDDVTHCLVVRFFGFNQNVDDVIELLNQRKKIIIEDCAHSLVNFLEQLKEKELRVNARICSINKLLPTIDGGMLYLQGQQQVSVKYCSCVDEIKGIVYLIGLTQLLHNLLPKRRKLSAQPIHPLSAPEKSSGLRYFSPADLTQASFRHSKLILQHTKLEQVKQRRRDNFNYLYAGLKDVNAGQPLYHCSATAVPYVFPFVMKHASSFNALRQKQVQVLRWEEVAESNCQVSKKYRTHLAQLPCHHQLTQSQLDYIIDSVKAL